MKIGKIILFFILIGIFTYLFFSFNFKTDENELETINKIDKNNFSKNNIISENKNIVVNNNKNILKNNSKKTIENNLINNTKIINKTQKYYNFVTRKENYLMYKNSKIILKGLNLDAGRVDPGDGNWQFNCPKTDCRPIYNELWSEKDYVKIKKLGFNSVRLILNYMYFEDDSNSYNYKQEGWDWLDKHINWAKKNNLLLILDMHVPQGGLQTTEKEDEIWDKIENQKRLIALWKEIAIRYKDENIIAGYNLLNEPQPRISCKPWKELSNKIIDTIRKVDNNHLIILEKCNWIRDAKDYDGWYKNVHPNWQFLVDDKNVLYDFHFYMPQDFALQCYPNINCPDGSKYPNNNYHVLSIKGENLKLNKQYLETEINTLLEFSKKNNVPASVGEWAPAPATFGKGGEEYILDVIDIFDKNNVSWMYFDYWTIHKDNTLKEIRPIVYDFFR